MGHRKDADDAVTIFHHLAQHTLGKIVVAPDRTIGNHHTLGEACGAARIVDHRQFVTTLLPIIAHMLRPEILGIFRAEEGVEMLPRVGEFVGTREQQRIVGDMDDSLQIGHLRGIDGGSHHVAHKEQFRLAVVHDVVNLFGQELMQDGNGYSSIGERRQEGHCPMGTVAAAECNLVATFHAAVLKQNMQLLYLARYIVILQGGTLVVGQGILVPMADDALLDDFIQTVHRLGNYL